MTSRFGDTAFRDLFTVESQWPVRYAERVYDAVARLKAIQSGTAQEDEADIALEHGGVVMKDARELLERRKRDWK